MELKTYIRLYILFEEAFAPHWQSSYLASRHTFFEQKSAHPQKPCF